jgi:hypothetical protein
MQKSIIIGVDPPRGVCAIGCVEKQLLSYKPTKSVLDVLDYIACHSSTDTVVRCEWPQMNPHIWTAKKYMNMAQKMRVATCVGMNMGYAVVIREYCIRHKYEFCEIPPKGAKPTVEHIEAYFGVIVKNEHVRDAIGIASGLKGW